jgi:heme-degrading monooxygenase HmoA
MFVIIWTYEVAEESRAAFESAYGPDGVWARFFREGAGYLGTELLRSGTNRYVTVDRWESRSGYEAFLERHRGRYAEIDDACGNLTERERFIGVFESVRTEKE